MFPTRSVRRRGARGAAKAQTLSARLQRDAMAQDARQHRQGLWREDQQHTTSLEQDRVLHAESLHVDHRLHFEGILSDLREQDREADHDLWEQRTERFQMLMTVSSLLISGGFALAVEGQLPPNTGCWDLLGSNETELTPACALRHPPHRRARGGPLQLDRCRRQRHAQLEGAARGGEEGA